jgi:hypothetical protein
MLAAVARALAVELMDAAMLADAHLSAGGDS